MAGYRRERDTLGEVRVPSDAYYGPQTQRARENFPVSGIRLQTRFVRAQGVLKEAAAKANVKLGVLEEKRGRAIARAAREVSEGRFAEHFVLDVYQSGAGTSQNMNANEVIANRAVEILGGEIGDYALVHPNDHVNMAQSSNDTIHVAMHIAAVEAMKRELIPALDDLRRALRKKSREFKDVVKPGRTHLQDAVPITLGQEFSGYAAVVKKGIKRVEVAEDALREINMGATAVGTGLNAHPDFSTTSVREISRITGIAFRPPDNPFEAAQNTDAAVEASGALRTLAVGLIKMADDLRLLSSGPRSGLGEIMLPPVQPGSSIMPGKVNPVMAEMLNMACFQVMGNDTAIAFAGQAGQLELNVMMPVIAYNLLNSIEILAGAVRAFTGRCIKGITADTERCAKSADRSLALATALAPKIGHERAAEVAKKAYSTGKSVREVALKEGLITEKEARKLLDPKKMTKIRSKAYRRI
ncbi:MAG: class II fumarate hydratase [Candidatus Hydrothermarchaeaceae archaeon]